MFAQQQKLQTMPHRDADEQPNWWQLVLTGILAIAFGAAAIVLPVGILSTRILDALFGEAKPLSGGMTAVAALLALVAVIAIDALVHLLGTGVVSKRASRIRGIVGVVVVIAAIFWPDWTVFAAVKLIGIWAILIGVLELFFARYSSKDGKERALFIIAAIASIAVGVLIMKEVLFGAVLVSALIGVAAAARGISLIVLGVSHRFRHGEPSAKRAVRGAA